LAEMGLAKGDLERLRKRLEEEVPVDGLGRTRRSCPTNGRRGEAVWCPLRSAPLGGTVVCHSVDFHNGARLDDSGTLLIVARYG